MGRQLARIYSSFGPLLTLPLLLGLPLAVQAQSNPVCGPEVKEEAAKALSALADLPPREKRAAEVELYQKYLPCTADAKLTLPADPFFVAARQCGARVPIRGSLFFEEMSCCGYDPQRRQFACPVKIKQPFGFGLVPLPGSREYVLHCVANAAGVLVPVGVDSVHLANEMHGQLPSWQFAVIANANNNDNLGTIYPMNSETRRARSILSWGFQPTGCNFQPIWGNAIEYRIRLDQ
jgi:hypothetical protein